MAFNDYGKVISFQPNWKESDIVERIEFQTDVLRSKDGSEERHVERDAPRLTLDYTVSSFGNEAAFIRNVMKRKAWERLYVPFWPWMTKLSEAYSSGTNLITVADYNIPFSVEGYLAIVDGTGRVVESIQIQSIGGDHGEVLTLYLPLANDWPKGAWVVPSGRGYLQDSFSVKHSYVTANVAETKIQFAYLPEEPPVRELTAETDFHFASVGYLLKFDGAHSAEASVDSGPLALAVTHNNSARLSNTQAKFGPTSLTLPGNSEFRNVSVVDDSRLEPGESDWTWECWFYHLTSGNGTLLTKEISSANFSPIRIRVTPANLLVAEASFDGTTYAVSISGGTVPISQWAHCALTRRGPVFRLFLDGALVATATATGELVSNSRAWVVGSDLDAYSFHGYIDSVRYTIGVARYTDSFPKPSSEFPALPSPYSTTHFGEEVWLWEPNWKSDVSGSSDQFANLIDKATGSMVQPDLERGLTPPPYNEVFEGRWFLNGRAAIAEFRDFCYRRKGRALGFWMPSWECDFEVTATIGSADTQFTAKMNYAETPDPILMRDRVIIFTYSGYYIRKLTAIAYSGASMTVSFDGSLGVSLAPSAILRVCYLKWSRLASDTAEISWKSPAFAEGKISVANIPAIYKGDPYYSYVTLLARLDTVSLGGDGEAVDNGPESRVVNVQWYGDPWEVPTVQAGFDQEGVFGGGCFWTAGNYYNQDGYGGMLVVTNGPSNIDASFDTDSPFTMECWVKPDTLGRAECLIIGFSQASTISGRHISIIMDSNVIKAKWGSHYTGVWTYIDGGVISMNQWHHVAVCRDANNLIKLYVDGVSVGTPVTNNTYFVTDLGRLMIGGQRNSGYRTELFKGSIDEVRFTKGICRYAGNFTPPTEPFPGSL